MKYKNKTQKTLLIGSLFWYFIAFFFAYTASTLANTNTVTCIDTIAGYSSSCQTSSAPNTEMTFELTKPDDSVIRFPCITNIEGKAKCDINAFHTKTSGLYKIGAYLSGYERPYDLSQSIFKVFPDNVSSVTSTFSASKISVEANGADSSYLTIQLKDKYNNPIKDHKVEIISSRQEDRVEEVQSNISNADGKVNFKVTSSSTGVSTFIARDSFAGITLTERPKIAFYESSSYVNNTSTTTNNYLKTDIFSSAPIGGTATAFKIEAPEEVQVNVPFDITVEALDSNGDPALSYRGTIFFSTTGDSNASLPLQNEGYTFKGTDENASHTFSQAVIFSVTGNVNLVVTDIDNPEMEAEKIIKVVSGSVANNNVNSQSSGDIEITSPYNGSTYGETTVNIIGNMTPYTKFIIEDEGVQLGDDMSDSDGNFIFEARGLSDGKHTFTVIALDSNDSIIDKSSPVIVYIDTKTAMLQDLSILPNNNVTANSSVQIILKSEAGLSKARIIIDDSVAYDLVEEDTMPGTYSVEFNAPGEEGEYDIKVVLTNSLGQESSPVTNEKLVVKGQTNNTVSTITGLKVSESSAPGSLTLMWDSLPESFDFEEYNIYYDTNPLTLNNKTVSPNKNPSFTLTELETGVTYYFSVSAVDSLGNETFKSDIIPGTVEKLVTSNAIENVKALSEDGRITFSWADPNISEIVKYKIEYGIRSGEYLENVYTFDNKNTWYIPDLINSMTYYFKIHALDKNNNIILSSDETIAVAGGEQYQESTCNPHDVQNLRIVTRGKERILAWDAVPGISTYRVYAGTQQGTFNLPTREVKDTYFTIPYLQPDTPYFFFAVKAVCDGNKKESLNFSNILKIEVGPEAIVMVALSFILIIGVQSFRRKRRRHNILRMKSK